MSKKNSTEKGGEQVTMQTVVMMRNVALVHLIAGQEQLFRDLHYDERNWQGGERRTLPAGFVLRLMEHGLPLKPHTPNDGSFTRHWNPQAQTQDQRQNGITAHIAALKEQYKGEKWVRVRFVLDGPGGSLGGGLILEHDALGYPLSVRTDEIRAYPASLVEKLTLPFEKVKEIDPAVENVQRSFVRLHREYREQLPQRKKVSGFEEAMREVDKLELERFEAIGQGDFGRAHIIEREVRDIFLDL